MARKLLEQFTLASAVTAALTVVDKKRLTFTVDIDGDEVCDLSGKVKRFRDVDTFVSAVLGVSPSTNSIECTINTAGVRVPRIPTDPIGFATATKNRLLLRKSSAVTKQTELAANLVAIAGYNNSGNASLQAHYDEVSAQKNAVDGAITYLDAQIAIQDAIINPGN